MPIMTPRFFIRSASILALFGLLGIAPANARVIWVGPNADPACETNSLSAAVFSAAVGAGDDVIHLADGVDHININLALNGFDPNGTQGSLAIRGGFANCGDAAPTSGRTTIDGGAPTRSSRSARPAVIQSSS